MRSFKKNKDQYNKPDSITNSPGRGGRRLIGGRQSALLREDSTSRRLDDFNRPSGYHPSQPLVTGRTTEGISPKNEPPSMTNMTPSVNMLDPNFKQPKKGKKENHPKLRKIKRISIIVTLALVLLGYLLIKRQ